MLPPRPSVTPIPASALFHFALAQDEYVGVLNACQYFATHLKDPKAKDTMLRAIARLNSPTGISTQSEGEANIAVRDAEAKTSKQVGSPDTATSRPNSGCNSRDGGQK